ncbi:FAD:protein FMN transferase [Tenacibaculum amylolyticum]|uniref:FAD:protein FMN transferase n=1 Tax=Tenacibaculum amylolyticum TaxID=104269 RepID=UPI003893D3E5
MKRIQYFLVLTVLATCVLGCKVEEKKSYTKLQGRVFGTTYNIIYKSNVNYQEPIDELFEAFNNSLSAYIPNSIISKVNENDTTVVVDAYFIEAYDKANRIYRETDGYFDPTIGKLIDAYGFGSGEEKKNLSKEEVDSLMNLKGLEKIKIIDNKVEKDPVIAYNVNAFAKGLGVDVIGRFIEEKGIKDYLVEIGGEIRARGNSPRDTFWKVAIDDPNTDGSRSQSRTIELNNQSMATSGNYRKFKLNANGEKIVHTVNPKTGLAQESNLLSVSVLLKGDCADVDAYATAFLAMGLEETKEFVKNRPDLKVILLFADEIGQIQEFRN